MGYQKRSPKSCLFLVSIPLLSFQIPPLFILSVFSLTVFTLFQLTQAFSPLCSTTNPLCFCLSAFASINSLIQSILSLLFPTAK